MINLRQEHQHLGHHIRQVVDSDAQIDGRSPSNVGALSFWLCQVRGSSCQEAAHPIKRQGFKLEEIFGSNGQECNQTLQLSRPEVLGVELILKTAVESRIYQHLDQAVVRPVQQRKV